MANIPLQSISFPGLSDKYTTPVVDNTLTQAGAAADAKKTGDEIGAIKNDLSEKADKSEALSAYIVETETGSIASFTDGADDVPVKDLTVAIEPAQDLHGQSSPYPAGGGKNIGYISEDNCISHQRDSVEYKNNGAVVTSTADYGRAGFTMPVVNGQQYTVSFKAKKTGNAYAIQFNNANEFAYSYRAEILTETLTSYSFNITATSDIFFVGIYPNAAGTNITVEDFQLEKGSTATAFAPYSNICPISGWTGANVTVNDDVFSIDFPTEAGTVYGGTLDVTTGVLTVDRAIVDLGTLNWGYNSGYGFYVNRESSLLPANAKAFDAGTKANIVCSAYKTETYSKTTSGDYPMCIGLGTTFFAVSDTRYDNATSFKTASSGVMLCYELATPQTYQLTPQEVSTILGQNNIFADTGNVTVQYRADTKLYIDKVLNT